MAARSIFLLGFEPARCSLGAGMAAPGAGRNRGSDMTTLLRKVVQCGLGRSGGLLPLAMGRFCW
jgi:hypothetical protein